MSLNVHVLPMSQSGARRTQAIAEWIDSKRARANDVIALQEAFAPAIPVLRRSFMQRGTAYRSGVVGSGLYSWSSLSVASVSFHRFSKNGSPLELWRGDWYAGKGVGLARILLGEWRVVVANVHAIARYTISDGYHEDRLVQAAEMGSVINAEIKFSDAVLLIGDFNFERGSAEWSALGLDHNALIVPSPPTAIDHAVVLTRSGCQAQLLEARYDYELERLGLTDHPAVVGKIRLSDMVER